ncbi:helix-turn-helix domain-containing protein [Herpetosiphon giganteus]|uniref:helix-turn-helix domain-containing protein n=1 Tax=Herpetosiphon giganteus TaxID=2029754 RepID=UPI001956EA67|nr:helix-turn-helix transcriptional regulator [Herpetosiphon giganteus]MBM7842180.1 transcriptional regulator with XRE-family HTH domain [Herpetosiphon giganteus]
MNTKNPADIFQERNTEIGRILSLARQTQKRTVSECAQHISTSRRRYTAIEKGAAAINVPELEALMQFLGVPVSAIWKNSDDIVDHRHVTVQASPGERIQVIVEIKEAEI